MSGVGSGRQRMLDRARGAVLASAVGDALGAGYEFESAPLGPDGPRMIGGGLGGFAPGEWTDDTTMAWCVLDAEARGLDLRRAEGLDHVAANFRAWFETRPPDIGRQTHLVLEAAGPSPTAATLTGVSADLHRQTGRTGGNGSLMRTGPVALPFLTDGREDACAEAARRVSDLTHADPRAGEACVLWSLAIRTAIRTGGFDIRPGLMHLDAGARDFWSDRLREAEELAPRTFRPNGYVVPALQAAWAAITQTPVPDTRPERHLVDALTTVIAIGDDTDTTAAIAGALLGARWGASAVPVVWRTICHGHPGITADDLVGLADLAVGESLAG